ncbi:MAG: hypothetical protein GX601_17115, partial [Anaerolineales bacterium]|nr:hypothetical protein [Anaerolineales bacterium]
MGINADHVQLTLDMEPGLAERYGSLKEAVAAGVYRNGLKRVAGKLYVYPGNLSVMLSDDGQRHFDLDLLEQYIEAFDDLTPIYYLVARFCGDRFADQSDALSRVQSLLEELPGLLANAGVKGKKR